MPVVIYLASIAINHCVVIDITLGIVNESFVFRREKFSDCEPLHIPFDRFPSRSRKRAAPRVSLSTASMNRWRNRMLQTPMKFRTIPNSARLPAALR
jgi:hypothetical protein